MNNLNLTSRSIKIVIGAAVIIGGSLIIRGELIKLNRKRKGLPFGPIGYPIFGNLYDITDSKEDYNQVIKGNFNTNKCNKLLIKWGKKQDIFTLRIGNKDMIVISSLKLYKDLHLNNKIMLNEYRPNIKKSLFGFSVFAFENQDNLWWERRKFIMQTLIRQFNSNFINKIFEGHFNKLVKEFDDKLSNNNNSFIWSSPFVDISKINFIATYQLMFNDFEDNFDNKLFIDFQYGIYTVFKQFTSWFLVDQLPFYISNWFVTHGKNEKILKKYVYPMLEKAYNKAMKNLNNDNDDDDDNKSLIDYMVNNKLYINNKERIFGDCLIMLILGMAGTSIRLTNACHCLAIYPEVYQIIYNELNNIYPNYKSAKDFTFKKSNKCHNLRAFIYDVIRLSNDIKLGLMRVNHSGKNIKIKSEKNGDKKDKTYIIPPNYNVLTNTFYIEKYDSNYEYPFSLYLPHFLDKENQNKFIKHESFFNFGSGQRDCVGKSVAIKEMMYILTNIILSGYKFKPHESDPNYENVTKISPYYLRPSPYPGKDNLHKVKIICTKR